MLDLRDTELFASDLYKVGIYVNVDDLKIEETCYMNYLPADEHIAGRFKSDSEWIMFDIGQFTHGEEELVLQHV